MAPHSGLALAGPAESLVYLALDRVLHTVSCW
jgi:hypothetical protein